MRITIAICDALDYIHSHGVVHRDLKPENIMVDDDDRIKLIDFGIAGKEGSRRLTFAKLSQVMGTPDYISPEQVKGKRGDGRSDIYALGVMLYEMLTGKTPFTGDNPLRHHERPAAEQSHAAARARALHLAAAAGDHLPRPRARSQEPLRHAREFAWDLEHQDQVGVADRAELHDWKQKKSQLPQKIFMYVGLALIPIVIFTLLLWVARKT